MHEDARDEQDALELVGSVELLGSRDDVRGMVWLQAEELLKQGHGEADVVATFASPAMAAAHQAWRILGELEVRRIVGDVARAGRGARRRAGHGLESPGETKLSLRVVHGA